MVEYRFRANEAYPGAFIVVTVLLKTSHFCIHARCFGVLPR